MVLFIITLFLRTTFLSCLQQIPGMAQLQNATTDVVHSVKSRIYEYFRPDPKFFPEKPHRFSAVYSRDKEYLCV